MDEQRVLEVVGSSLPLSEVIDATFGMTRNLWALRDKLGAMDNDELVELFRLAGQFEAFSYATRCQICHLLAARHTIGEKQDQGPGLKEAARLLGISNQQAKTMSAVWGAIFSKMQDQEEVPALPAHHYEVAWKAAPKNKVDPVEAIQYADHVRNAMGREYPASQFKSDIERGLPDPEDEPRYQAPIASCLNCTHWDKAQLDAMLYLSDGKEIVAQSPGEGEEYCRKLNRMRRALGELSRRAMHCEHYEGV